MLTTTIPEGAPAAQPPLQQQLGLQQAGPARVGGNGGVRKVATKQRRCLRSRMRHTVSDRLVYCHEALLLRIKRTKAGGGLVVGFPKGAGAVKWESDSDSDENNSDNEEDLMV